MLFIRNVAQFICVTSVGSVGGLAATAAVFDISEITQSVKHDKSSSIS